MKKLSFAITAVILFGFAAPVFADDVTKTVTKEEHKVGKKHSKDKVESKTTHDPDGLMNSTTDKTKVETDSKVKADGTTETTTEKTVNHDAPGMKNDKKIKSKEKVTKDAAGNVIKDEVK